MKFTDLFVQRPVLATVVSLMILALGLRALGLLTVRQYPYTQNAIITVSTAFLGANPETIAGFITTPLEASIAQANGIDYMTSTSTLSSSTITVNLRLNYDTQKALSEITTKVNAVLNQLPRNAQLPVITISVGQTIDVLYMGFYSEVLAINQISDYLLRVVQPKLQTISGVQVAEILGGRKFAMRIWLDPKKLAGFGLTSADVALALQDNDFIPGAGRTDGTMFVINLTANTGLSTVEGFKKLIIKARNGAIIRIEDVGTVSLGATNYDSSVSFNGKKSVYIGIQTTPEANLLDVIRDVKNAFGKLQKQLPEGLHAEIVYDSGIFVNSSIHEVINSLMEAIVIVTVVIFLFLGSMRSVIIPLVAIPLSIIGTFFIMFVLHFSINLLTLLSLVLAIGLVVDDAIIVVENVQRHIELGMPRLKAAMQGARELANPIMAITVVLIAVYAPIGFMSGLTGALFTEFAFSLAGAVTVSAVIALTLSPMMCSKFLNEPGQTQKNKFISFIDRQFDWLRGKYEKVLHDVLNNLAIAVVFAIIILISIYFLYSTSKSELAPTEDQGVIISQAITEPNASLQQTEIFAHEIFKIYKTFPETYAVFQLNGLAGLNQAIAGMALTPWDQRSRTAKQLQPLVQKKLNDVTGAIIAVFQLPPLPGSRGLPIQFVLLSTDPFERLDQVNQAFLAKVRESGLFAFTDTDLKIDKEQVKFIINRDKVAEFGLTMLDVVNVLGSSLSENYINYFELAGRSYQVIPETNRVTRLTYDQILDYYIKTATGMPIKLGTVAKIERRVVPESLNHFQQLNSATLLAVPGPGVTMGQALDQLVKIANEVLPEGYSVDYAGPSRQYVQESAALLVTFFFALLVIFLSLAALFESFRDPLIVLISVPMSICGALIFICLGVGGATLNIYTEVGLVTLIGLISKHGILIVQFANDLQLEGKSKREAIELAAGIRLRPILMTTAAMVLGVVPLIMATGAGAVSRYSIGLVIATGISIGTLFTLFMVPSMYMIMAQSHHKPKPVELDTEEPLVY